MGEAEELQQNRLDTKNFWTHLTETQNAEELLTVTNAQISTAVNKKLLTREKADELSDRQTEMRVAIRSESVTRYPVQIPGKSAQETYSDKYEEKMSESKRTKRQNRLGTVLHRKKLNAEDVEGAESKHQDEKSRLLGAVMQIIEDSDSQLEDPNSKFLQGTTAADFMAGPDVSDLSEFLVNSRSQMETNLKVLKGARDHKILDESSGKECVRQFMELDLSADLRTDKALAKDADRLEKVTGKVRAMINLVDRHPEIEERMEPREREEFEGKLDRAFALLDYYQLRKDIITDKYYRTHENSEISMRFERKTKDNASTPSKEMRYLEQQNLTRKIWTAEHAAMVQVGQYSSRSLASFEFFRYDVRLGRKQEDTDGNATPWSEVLQRYYQMKETQSEEERGINVNFPPHTFNTDTFKGEYFSSHYDLNDPVCKAIRNAGRIAGTTDRIEDLDRSYIGFAEWRGLDALTDQEFTEMMENFTAFNQEVKAETPANTVTALKEKQLNALRTYKKVIRAQIPYLKEKYGVGLLLEIPQTVTEFGGEIRKDIGNSQTITDLMEIFKKYGIMDEEDPDDREMETVMWYMYNIIDAAHTTSTEMKLKLESGELPSFTDMMREYIVVNERKLKDMPASLILRIRELERNLDMNTKVQWTARPNFGS